MQYKPFWLQAISAFIFGLAALNIVIVFDLLFPSRGIFFYALTYGPWLEEGVKYLVILILFTKTRWYIVPFVGLGFGLGEAVRHQEIFHVVSIKPIFAHVVFAIVATYCFRHAKTSGVNRTEKGFWYFMAFLFPVLLHISYNLMVSR